MNFATVEEAVQDVAAGKAVVVIDDPGRENEGDLIFSAALATPELVAFTVRYTSGVVCVALDGDTCDRLELPQMVARGDESMGTAFTISIDVRAGTTTGISASDRAKTIVALCDHGAKASDFARPGHVFPLRAREGGVLKRPGHTEAALDLAVLAGLPAAGVLAEIVSEDGEMARTPELMDFAETHGLKVITIADLVAYRRQREPLVSHGPAARLPTRFGEFTAIEFTELNGIEHVAMVMGDIADGEPVLARVHSECLTGDIMASTRCDCGPQLEASLRMVAREGRGVVVYLRGHEGRGIGLAHKLSAYGMQDLGFDTVDANRELGLPVDSRDYGVGAQILAYLGATSLRLMTNNPAKYAGLSSYGLTIVERVPVQVLPNAENAKYLRTKQERLGHLLDLDEPILEQTWL